MAHEPEPISPEPEPRDARVIPIGLGYRPAATPGAPRMSPSEDQAIGEVVNAEPVDQPAVTADTGSWIDQRRTYLSFTPTASSRRWLPIGRTCTGRGWMRKIAQSALHC